MKKLLFYGLLALAALPACKKDAKDNTNPKAENPASVTAAVTSLKKTDSLSAFANALSAMDLSKDNLDEVTVFAAPNSAFANYDPNARQSDAAPAIPDSVIRKHLVKGFIKLSQLKDGQQLTTLSGQTLTFMIKEGKIWVNGVEILHSDSADTKFVIHTIARLLNPSTKPSTLTVEVYNTIKWTTALPAGAPQAGAQVKLYKTHLDFQNNAAPAYTAETDNAGKAVFSNVTGGNYYIVATYDELNNLLGAVKQQNGTFLGFISDSLYQTQEEVAGGPSDASAAPGNFRLADVNGDGVINANDRVLLPAHDVTLVSGVSVSKRILIGTANNSQVRPFANEAQVNAALAACYAQLSPWHEMQTAIDAIYTDDADCSKLPDWCNFNTYTINPTNNNIATLWISGFQLISQLNRILLQTDGTSMNADQKNIAKGEASAMKGYIYLQLITYFGEVPFHDDLKLAANQVRKDLTASYAYARKLLEDGSSLLPAQPASTSRFSSNACKALLARLYLQTQQPLQAIEYSTSVINAGKYMLEAPNVIFSKPANREIIFSSADAINFTPLKTTFTKGTFVPEVRYTEVMLTAAEAMNSQGRKMEAVNIVNMLHNRDTLATLSPAIDDQQFRQTLMTDWKNSMKTEGIRLAALSRWNMLEPVLGPSGFRMQNKLLPIPQIVIDQNPTMMQNPGY